MYQSMMWKNCTGYCASIEGQNKKTCINCENHESTSEILMDEAYKQMTADYEEYQLEDEFYEQVAMFLEEVELGQYTLVEHEDDIATEDSYDMSEGGEFMIFKIARQVIDLVANWHENSHRGSFTKEFNKLQCFMERVLLDGSMTVPERNRELYYETRDSKQLEWIDLA
jgi:hypothetical protein